MFHSASVNMSEKESLLGNHTESTCYSSVKMLDQPPSSSDLDTTSSVNVFRSRSVLRNPSEDFYNRGIPIWRAVLLVVNAALGAGILNFPQAYAKCGGIGTALAFQMGLLVFITGAFLILAYCADKHGSQNFQEIVLGKAIESQPPWYFKRDFLMCFVSIVFLLPLCLPKTLKILSYSSALGTIGAFFVCAVTTVRYFDGNYPIKQHHTKVTIPWTETLAAVPIICFGFQCHVPAVAIYSEMKRASVPRFGIVTVIAMAICTTAYAITGSFGYLTFGAKVQGDVLMNYHANDVLVNMARVMLTLIVLSTAAVVLFCGRSCVEGLYLALFRMSPAVAEVNERKRRIIQTLIWFGLSLIIALFVTDIGKAVALIGGLAALFIFFFPGICLVQEMLQYPVLKLSKKLLIVLGLFYVVLGVFIFADSEVVAIMQDISKNALY
ncbi:putative sodium-coupled neutral amino acid transporter 7 [Acropora cervicornis]|uniref:Sodium-coupled neutral amino acid transporter 7 n=1 Tax=Acropora cervicornis TaxID=6130 RepID=A0AAD9QEX1_ACRCE|nr:putative sodium-coupled neutral amino acid transporter 7 [Acropora cervicornis]